jgi:hypothetical protein
MLAEARVVSRQLSPSMSHLDPKYNICSLQRQVDNSDSSLYWFEQSEIEVTKLAQAEYAS